ncbi:uncharacterized protein DS421_7g221370 [Arachis hypogaea]|nr:uncharacterized protein DS421_7g221370 [Arachis hypogaea]
MKYSGKKRKGKWKWERRKRIYSVDGPRETSPPSNYCMGGAVPLPRRETNVRESRRVLRETDTVAVKVFIVVVNRGSRTDRRRMRGSWSYCHRCQRLCHCHCWRGSHPSPPDLSLSLDLLPSPCTPLPGEDHNAMEGEVAVPPSLP